MKIGLHEWSTEPKANFETNLKLASKYGYECIELLQKNTDAYLESHSMEEMKHALTAASIRPSALSGLIGFNLLKDDREKQEKFAEFERLLNICKGVGCDVLIMVASPRGDVEDKAFIKEDAVALLLEYAPVAEKYGVKLSVEFLGFPWASINDFQQCYEIIQAVDRDDVGITFDCFHFYGNASKLEDLKKADGGKIFALHINDVTGKKQGEYVDDSLRVLPYDGEIPLVEIFRILDEIGVKQTPCMELFNEEIWTWEPEKAIPIFKDRTERVLTESGYNN